MEYVADYDSALGLFFGAGTPNKLQERFVVLLFHSTWVEQSREVIPTQ